METDLQRNASRTEGNPQAGGLPHSEAGEPPDDDEVVLATFWSWPSLLLVRLSPDSATPARPDSLMVVAPDPRGLQQLELLGAEIESMWLVHPPLTGGGHLETEEIRKVGPWPLTSLPKDRSTSFHCASGAIFVMRQGHMLRVEQRSLHWSSGGKFKLNSWSGQP